jgi:hypothetical protein
MKLKIEITMDNAAFDDDSEIGRILSDFSGELAGYSVLSGQSGVLRDINGNACGSWKVTK